MAPHNVEVRVAVDGNVEPSKITVRVICEECGTEEFSFWAQHVSPITITLSQVISDLDIPSANPAKSTREQFQTTEELTKRLKKGQGN